MELIHHPCTFDSPGWESSIPSMGLPYTPTLTNVRHVWQSHRSCLGIGMACFPRTPLDPRSDSVHLPTPTQTDWSTERQLLHRRLLRSAGLERRHRRSSAGNTRHWNDASEGGVFVQVDMKEMFHSSAQGHWRNWKPGAKPLEVTLNILASSTGFPWMSNCWLWLIWLWLMTRRSALGTPPGWWTGTHSPVTVGRGRETRCEEVYRSTCPNTP